MAEGLEILAKRAQRNHRLILAAFLVSSGGAAFVPQAERSLLLPVPASESANLAAVASILSSPSGGIFESGQAARIGTATPRRGAPATRSRLIAPRGSLPPALGNIGVPSPLATGATTPSGAAPSALSVVPSGDDSFGADPAPAPPFPSAPNSEQLALLNPSGPAGTQSNFTPSSASTSTSTGGTSSTTSSSGGTSTSSGDTSASTSTSTSTSSTSSGSEGTTTTSASTTSSGGGPVPGVPEPSTWLVMILGFFAAGIGLRARRAVSARAA